MISNAKDKLLLNKLTESMNQFENKYKQTDTKSLSHQDVCLCRRNC